MRTERVRLIFSLATSMEEIHRHKQNPGWSFRNGMKFDYFKYPNGNVDIFRKIKGRWVAYLYVRDSIAIKLPRGTTKGLFAARAFPTHFVIGRYTGKIICKAEGETDPKRIREKNRLEHSLDGDAVGTANGHNIDGRRPVQSNAEQVKAFGKVVLRQPNWGWPGMHAMMANDARGSAFRNNVQCTRGGYISVIRKIPAYSFQRRHDARGNGASEILWDYGGNNYWNGEDKLGTSKNTAIYVS